MSGEKRHLPAGGIPKLLAEVDFASLRRLSLLGLVISPPQLSSLLQACSASLEELYISVNGKNTVMQCEMLDSGAAAASGLRVLHVIAPEHWGPTIEDMIALARRLPKLEQVGTGNRVYEVFRRLADTDEEEGLVEEEGKVVELSRWSRTTTPAYFQIWRG